VGSSPTAGKEGDDLANRAPFFMELWDSNQASADQREDERTGRYAKTSEAARREPSGGRRPKGSPTAGKEGDGLTDRAPFFYGIVGLEQSPGKAQAFPKGATGISPEMPRAEECRPTGG
jgi:hypothetical protein